MIFSTMLVVIVNNLKGCLKHLNVEKSPNETEGKIKKRVRFADQENASFKPITVISSCFKVTTLALYAIGLVVVCNAARKWICDENI